MVQGLAFAIGSLTLKIGIAKIFNIKDDVSIKTVKKKLAVFCAFTFIAAYNVES